MKIVLDSWNSPDLSMTLRAHSLIDYSGKSVKVKSLNILTFINKTSNYANMIIYPLEEETRWDWKE